MKQYFKNLLKALLGQNPYQMELDELRQNYHKTADRVDELNSFYFESVAKFDQTRKQMIGSQKLIENLRTRVSEYKEELEGSRKDNSRLRRLLQEAENMKGE